MKRRSFLGALAGLVLAPFVVKASRGPHAKVDFRSTKPSQTVRVDEDWRPPDEDVYIKGMKVDWIKIG